MFSDTQLKAYLAGELSSDLATLLEEQIAHDNALETRLLSSERQQAARLQIAFSGIPDASRMDALENMVSNIPPTAKISEIGQASATSSNSGLSWGKLVPMSAVIAFAAFVMGGFFGSTTSQPTDLSWREQVAVYQALYVTETLATVEADPAALTAQLNTGAAALGRPLTLDVVRELDGLNLRRAQVLGFEGVPLVQLAYLSETGAPIALCAVKVAGDPAHGLRSEVLSGLPTVSWSDGDYSYMIVGDIDPQRLENMARTVQQTL